MIKMLIMTGLQGTQRAANCDLRVFSQRNFRVIYLKFRKQKIKRKKRAIQLSQRLLYRDYYIISPGVNGALS